MPWGYEVVWAIITPKESEGLKIKRIVCGAAYCKPGSKNKTLLLDHVYDTYQLLSSKYKDGIDWIISGDVNELKLDAILSLHPKLCQVVDFKTRPKSNATYIHDPIITSLSNYYRKPVGLQPLKSDNGLSESDHLTVFMEPMLSNSDTSAKKFIYVKIRRCPDAAIQKITACLDSESWSFIKNVKSAHKQAELLQKIFIGKGKLIFS